MAFAVGTAFGGHQRFIPFSSRTGFRFLAVNRLICAVPHSCRACSSSSSPSTTLFSSSSSTASGSGPASPTPPSTSTSFYKRPLPSHLVPFSSPDGRRLFQEALRANGMESYWTLAEQFHTQSEPAYIPLPSACLLLLIDCEEDIVFLDLLSLVHIVDLLHWRWCSMLFKLIRIVFGNPRGDGSVKTFLIVVLL